jgi:hypothetical protein
MIGCDPGDVDRLAGQLRRASSFVDGSVADIEHDVFNLRWSGDDFDGVISGFKRRISPACTAAVQQLNDLTVRLETQAREQRGTSRELGCLATGESDTPTSPRQTAPTNPSIPPAPNNPKHDPGAGEWGSQPAYAILDDIAWLETMKALATAADAAGYTNAARHLRHYLNNTGEDLEIDPDRIARDVPEFAEFSKKQAHQAAMKAAQDAIDAGTTGPVPFNSGWEGFYLEPGMSQDWFYALGGVQVATTGLVTVVPGEPPTFEIEYQTHVYDRYNWDGGKQVDIMGVTVTDQQMGELHTAGLAKEYDASGSSETHSMAAGSSSYGDPSSTIGDREGTRSDPTRDQQRGPARQGADGTPR